MAGSLLEFKLVIQDEATGSAISSLTPQVN
jgi:hypothetical protein